MCYVVIQLLDIKKKKYFKIFYDHYSLSLSQRVSQWRTQNSFVWVGVTIYLCIKNVINVILSILNVIFHKIKHYTCFILGEG